MDRPPLEVADIVRAAGDTFIERNRKWLRWMHIKVLLAIARCRTAALGGQTPPAQVRVWKRWPWVLSAALIPLIVLAVFRSSTGRTAGTSTSAVKTASLRASSPPSPKALEALLDGRQHAAEAFSQSIMKNGSKRKSEEEFAKCLNDLEKAIWEDPNYVPAYLELAQAIMGTGGQQPHADLNDKALAALNKALALDESNISTHLVLADFIGFGGGSDAAEPHYKKAIELGPNLAMTHEAYAEYLDDVGRFDLGMKEHQRAQELDQDEDYIGHSPLTPTAVRLERKRKFMHDVNFEGDVWTRGDLEFESGNYADALKDWELIARSKGYSEEADAWERAYAKGGGQALIRDVVRVMDGIAKEHWFPRDMIINAHRYAGDREGALAWLKTAAKEEDHVVRHVKSDLRWDPYRSDPRFQAIVRDSGLLP